MDMTFVKVGDKVNEKIEILGVKVDNYSLDEAVEKTTEFLNTDSLNTVGMISSNVLVEAIKLPGWTHKAETLDLIVIGDKEMYQAAKKDCRMTSLDIEENRYLREVFACIAEKQINVALLIEKKTDKPAFQRYMKRTYKGLVITDIFSMDEVAENEDNIVNLLNAAAEDVIVSAIASPYQEEFLSGNRQKLGAKLWIGLGQSVAMLEGGESKTSLLGKIIEKRLFKRKVSQYQNEKGE